jgi:pimeloyl-ACP methyl ester carboxylesterase
LQGEVTVEKLAMVLVEVLTASGIGRCRLYGNHTGAVLAAWIAVNHPEMVDRLMLSGPPLPSEERRAQMAASVIPMVIEEDGSHLVALWDRYRRFAVSSGLEVPHREVALHLIATHPVETFHAVINTDLPALYRAIAVPTMVVAGEMDTLRPGVDGIVQVIPGSVFEVVPDAGNFVVDEAPHAVADQIRSWFGSA